MNYVSNATFINKSHDFSLYLCMCVYIHIYIWRETVYMHIYTHTYIHVCICIYIQCKHIIVSLKSNTHTQGQMRRQIIYLDTYNIHSAENSDGINKNYSRLFCTSQFHEEIIPLSITVVKQHAFNMYIYSWKYTPLTLSKPQVVHLYVHIIYSHICNIFLVYMLAKKINMFTHFFFSPFQLF